MERVLVTGGSGFIGTNLVSRLIEDGYEVLNIDIKEPKNEEHRRLWKCIDIRNAEALRDAVLSFAPNYILHLAARCDLNGDSVDDYNANTDGVANIIDAALRLDNFKKIIITSSMLVCEPGYYPENEKDYHPSTIYGDSKVITEKVTWDKLGNRCDWAIVRPTSIWGPYFEVPYYDFFKMVMSGKYVHISGNKASMTYGYVGNTVAQYMAIMKDENDKSHVFYLGDYEPINIDEWADEIAIEVGKKILTIPYFIVYIAAKVGDLLKIIGMNFPITSFRLGNMTTSNVLDLSSTQRVLDKLPYTRKQGVRNTVKWIKENNFR